MKQENIIHNQEKNWSIIRPRNYRNDELEDKNIKTALLNMLPLYKKVEEKNINMIRG